MRWQAQSYAHFHATRANLTTHVALVPAFLLGNVTLLVALWPGNVAAALAGASAMAVSMALQGRGHALEPIPPVPFSGWKNALAREFLEQWLTFPQFVLAGGFLRAWRAPAR